MSAVQVQGQHDLDFLTRGDEVGKIMPLDPGQGPGNQNRAKIMEGELSKVVGSICDNKDFVMKTREGVVNNEGAKIKWAKRSFLEPKDPPPAAKRICPSNYKSSPKPSTTNSSASYPHLRMCITSEWGPKLQGSANSCMTKFWIMK